MSREKRSYRSTECLDNLNAMVFNRMSRMTDKVLKMGITSPEPVCARITKATVLVNNAN